MRGTHITEGPIVGQLRFIPARAGNACCKTFCQIAKSVHPRACGERHLLVGGFHLARGSSPRVRGTLRYHPRTPSRRRFIPARAGNASPRGFHPGAASVHPRACGERMWRGVRTIPRAGSSPRVRGTRRTLIDRHDRGSSPRVRGTLLAQVGAQSTCSPVHPRACGERSSCKRLRQRRIHDVKERTDIPLSFFSERGKSS